MGGRAVRHFNQLWWKVAFYYIDLLQSIFNLVKQYNVWGTSNEPFQFFASANPSVPWHIPSGVSLSTFFLIAPKHIQHPTNSKNIVGKVIPLLTLLVVGCLMTLAAVEESDWVRKNCKKLSFPSNFTWQQLQVLPGSNCKWVWRGSSKWPPAFRNCWCHWGSSVRFQLSTLLVPSKCTSSSGLRLWWEIVIFCY